jgi:PAS domain S-box-containing protein
MAANGDQPSGLPLEVFGPAPVAVAVTSGPGHVLIYANAYHRATFGDRPLGLSVREIFPDPERRRQYMDVLDEVLSSGEAKTFTSTPVTVRRPAGGTEERHFTFSLSPTPLPGDHQAGIVVVALDVTEQIATEERLARLSEERRRVLRRYSSLVATIAQMVWVSDPEGRVIERSPEWQRATGMNWESFRGHGWLSAAHPEDREGLRTAWLAAVRDVPEVFQHEYRLRHRDGAYRHCRLRATAVKEAGRVVEWVGSCRDVEEQWLERRRTELLAHASAAIGESPQAVDAFAALSRVIVPVLADECGIYLLPESDAPGSGLGGPLVVERIAAGAREGLPPGLPPHRQEHVPPGNGLDRAVRLRQPVHATFPPGEVPADVAPPGTLPWLTEMRAHSGVLVPVIIEGTVAAVVAAFVCEGRDPIGPDEMALMRELLEQAHDPLRHALEFQRTQRVALALQRSLLSEPARVEGLEIDARYVPSAAAAEVGGDWYDSFVLPDGASTLIIGDVAGHDLGAAVTMSKLRNMLRGLAADRVEPPGDILRRLDDATMLLSPDWQTATCVLARVEGEPLGGWSLSYSVAGHPPPLLTTAHEGGCFLTDAQGALLGGLHPSAPRRTALEPLPAGSTLLLYTDGLVERRDEDIDVSLERLRRRAGALAREPLDVFCRELLRGAPTTGEDDIALIALRVPQRRGAPGAPLTAPRTSAR